MKKRGGRVGVEGVGWGWEVRAGDTNLLRSQSMQTGADSAGQSVLFNESEGNEQPQLSRIMKRRRGFFFGGGGGGEGGGE